MESALVLVFLASLAGFAFAFSFALGFASFGFALGFAFAFFATAAGFVILALLGFVAALALDTFGAAFPAPLTAVLTTLALLGSLWVALAASTVLISTSPLVI